MATRPVKVLSDLLTKKQIIKQDTDGNILFRVTGSLGDGFISASIPVSASDTFFVKTSIAAASEFTAIPVITSSLDAYNIYDIDQAFHAIDTAIQTANGPDIQSAYTRLRFVEVNNFESDGTKIIILPSTGSSPAEIRFPASSIDYLSVQVWIKTSGSNSWLNDLVSVETLISGSGGDEVWISIDAPALSSDDKYKLIVVNENANDYVIL